MANILIIEDDKDINNLLSDLLDTHYQTFQANTASAGLRLFKEQPIDMVLLDLMLPDISGENVIALIREQSQCPILVITAKADVSVLVDVLQLGADDYIAKPFDTKEVTARVFRHLKRSGHPLESCVYQVENLLLDEQLHQVTYKQQDILLTAKEFDLLKVFMSNPQRVFTKANLYESVWHETYYGDDNTISVHISRLRAKLLEATGKDWLETIWGVGFKLTI